MSDQPKIYPLSSITKAIENLIAIHASGYYWVKAEIVKLNYYKQSGHCYPDLVEKVDGKIVAEIRGNIWKDDFIEINKKFKEVLNEELGDEMTVVCRAKVKYSSVYGLSLNIIDISPEYTMGELAKQKMETIRRLKTEGLFTLNQTKLLPVLPKTIAVISVESSKGYQDFINVIDKNNWAYAFHIKLFPAILQGTKSVITITEQLKVISKYAHIFDAVTIIRGGGGDVGLSSFDSYELAKEVANFPIPVLSGIGHSTNLTVTEMVSHKHFITPTKMAEFLIQKFHNFSVPLKENTVKIEHLAGSMLDRNKSALKEAARLFNSLTVNYLKVEKHQLSNISTEIIHRTKSILTNYRNILKHDSLSLNFFGNAFIKSEKIALQDFKKQMGIHIKNSLEVANTKLLNLKQQIKLLSPENVLQRGFSITRLNGKSVRNITQLKKGDLIMTQLAAGTIESIINKLK